MFENRVTAAVLLIGDELLSGRTQDANLQILTKFLAPRGVQVIEACVVPDVPETIIAAINELRAAYDYVFTTGGIGPTHDDKTADAVAAGFGVHIDVRDDARAILEAYYKGSAHLNDASLRMARIPDGAVLIANPISGAPGFQIGNVFVMAGVPSVMRAMLEDVSTRIQGGAIVRSVTVRASGVRESQLARGLEALEKAAQDVSFGSYPWFAAGSYGVELVARAADAAALEKAGNDLQALVRACGGAPERVDDDAQ